MDGFNWEHEENEYKISVQQGVAIIVEVNDGERTIFKPYLKDNQGKIVTSFEPGFDNFETAEAYIDANLIELDRLGVDDSTFRQNLITTLDLGISLFSEKSYPFHRARLENIKRWFSGQRFYSDMIQPPASDWSNYIFDWQQEERGYISNTPHGLVIITSASGYSIQIEDITGVVLKDYYLPSSDFAAAESRLREILSEMEQPFVSEEYLDQIIYTLQICQRLMPDTADFMEFVRLRYIETYLSEVLP